ncbi:dienelactone hydrolase [Paucibacter sp. AS339]|uniref:alpha/beta hydrolase family protein n=1 Tax=Paucibacter hankyongi TaxID=3133434 RepID=UPI0030B788AE
MIEVGFMRRLSLALLMLATLGAPAWAGMGMTEIALAGNGAGSGPVTVYYSSAEAEQPQHFGPLTLSLALNAKPQRGNGRLVLISHGSGGSPWVHADLARRLVGAGFIVAMPAHQGDNYKDPGRPGPDSWALRPLEMSRAIDALAAEPRFAPLLALDKVGAYGGSAGGHTVLSLAGGRWSRAGFKQHCESHLADDFQACVGLTTRLNGDWLDALKLWAARLIIAFKFDDARPQQYVDPRIAAVVASVPAAADFDMSTLEQPSIPLGLVTARQDRWLHPQWHSDEVLKACAQRCEWLADLPQGGHGAMLSPLPPGFTGLLGHLLNDPPGFDRSSLAEVDRQITDFMQRHLLD